MHAYEAHIASSGPSAWPVQGYRAQSSMILDSLEALLASCASRGESLVIEGVLLSTDNILALMSRHHNIIPFLIHISNEAKHRERFAVCALAPGRAIACPLVS